MKLFCMKIDFLISQRGENVLFLPSNIAAMKALYSLENPKTRRASFSLPKANLTERRKLPIPICQTKLNLNVTTQMKALDEHILMVLFVSLLRRFYDFSRVNWTKKNSSESGKEHKSSAGH